MHNQDLSASKPIGGTTLITPRKPGFFKDVIGQAAAINQLTAMFASGMISHIILVGQSGVGKTTLARLFAKLLNCTRPRDHEPCGTCASCATMDQGGRHRTYHERNAAGRDGSKEEMADFLEHDLGPVPPGYRYRVVFFDEMQHSSTYAQDLLLKPLEEPGSRTIFIFALIDVARLPEAFQARCRVIRLETPTFDEKLQGLERRCAEEGISADVDALRLIAERSQNFRRAFARLLQVRDATRGMSRVTVDLARQTLFQEESSAAICFLSAALDGDMPTALHAIAQLGRDAALCFQSIQRLSLHIKKTMIGPHFALATRGEFLLYDDAAIRTLVEKIARNAARVSQSTVAFYDAQLEHWTHIPVATLEAFEAHAIRFVDLCAGYNHDAKPVDALARIPLMGEAYRSTSGRRARITRQRLSARPAPRGQYVSVAQAFECYEAATFLTQEYGVTLNAALPVNWRQFDANVEADFAARMTGLGRELAQRFSAWAPTHAAAGGLHRISFLGRDEVGALTAVMLFHLPDPLMVRTEDWLAGWFTRAARRHSPPAQIPVLDYRSPSDPRNSIGRQNRLLGRHIWAGIDPADDAQGVPLIERLGVPERQRRPAGQVVGARLHMSQSIGQRSQAEALEAGMGHVSAWRSGRWDQLLSGWEFREHRERADVRASRADRLAIFAARRAATGDPMTRALIDQLERDERASWMLDPLHRPRSRPCWPHPTNFNKSHRKF